jgi:hypothetical protein
MSQSGHSETSKLACPNRCPVPYQVNPCDVGAKLDVLADMLGNAEASTTRICAQVVNKMQENPARFLEAMLAA